VLLPVDVDARNAGLRTAFSTDSGHGNRSPTESSMAKAPEVGDKVSWDSSGGHSTGRVVKKQTSPTTVKGHKVAASKEDPQFIVESDKSGKRAAHKPGALKKA
jgi:Hypervirulence associated proteins TUDOR domain